MSAMTTRSNVTESIKAKMGAGLLKASNHPLARIAASIREYFSEFAWHDSLPPTVTVEQNFDELLTPPDHVSRSPSDTYYVDDGHVLRSHMTAHQTTLLRKGYRAFLMAGDVYRRDEIDATHYPVFHQIDGVRVFDESELPVPAGEAAIAYVMADLKHTLEGMARHLFGHCEMRWVDAYFPFTDPSLELEILFEGRWLEVLGCGVIQKKILTNAGLLNCIGWAFGMGVERLAMAVHDIPDIRLFWSQDPRFLIQFQEPGHVKFKPYSRHPGCYKDIAFWVTGAYHDNDLCAVVREVAQDLCESVTLVDAFTHPKTGKSSRCYRILYRSMERSLTNEEVDELQEHVRARIEAELPVILR